MLQIAQNVSTALKLGERRALWSVLSKPSQGQVPGRIRNCHELYWRDRARQTNGHGGLRNTPDILLVRAGVGIDYLIGLGIAHESIHSQLYNDYLRSSTIAFVRVPDNVWTGEAAEKICCEHQMRVLKEIGAPLSEIAYYTWNPSNRYWEIPYEKRNW